LNGALSKALVSIDVVYRRGFQWQSRAIRSLGCCRGCWARWFHAGSSYFLRPPDARPAVAQRPQTQQRFKKPHPKCGACL